MPKYQSSPIVQMTVGMNVEGFYLLSAANIKTSANNSQFLAGKLRDTTSEIDFKVWDYYGSDIHDHVGGIVKIRGAVQEYNGAKQIIIDRIRMAQEGDQYDLRAIIPSAPIDVDTVLRDIELGALGTITDQVYKQIAMKAFERMKDCLRTLPAAKSVHHAFIAGLLMHTYNIMKLCTCAADVYGRDLVDLDLLLTGAFCHDMAKRKEYLFSEIGLATDYSLQGHLLGHLTMGAQEIADIARECNIPVDSEQVILLQHLLLSHHGELEFGAAVLPKTVEAEILSRLDMLDARVEVYRETLSEVEMGKTSDFVKALGHPVYNHF